MIGVIFSSGARVYIKPSFYIKATSPYIIIMNQCKDIILLFGYYDPHQTLDRLPSHHSASKRSSDRIPTYSATDSLQSRHGHRCRGARLLKSPTQLQP